MTSDRNLAAARRRRLLAMLMVGVVVGSGCSPSSQARDDRPLLVAAAADLQPAFTLLGERFEEATGDRVSFSFGSSGQLAQQLMEGAPMDVYASANVSFVERVLAAGVGNRATQQTYGIGRITIWSTADRWDGWTDLNDLGADADARIVAIANPEHAPYGLAARQALEAAGVWDDLQPRLVFGENIADTQRLAASGNADVAIVALSLALASDQIGEGRWVLINDALHAPLQQDLVVITDDPDRAERATAFVDFVMAPEGRAVMRQFGFLLPGEPPPDSWDR